MDARLATLEYAMQHDYVKPSSHLSQPTFCRLRRGITGVSIIIVQGSWNEEKVVHAVSDKCYLNIDGCVSGSIGGDEISRGRFGWGNWHWHLQLGEPQLPGDGVQMPE